MKFDETWFWWTSGPVDSIIHWFIMFPIGGIPSHFSRYDRLLLKSGLPLAIQAGKKKGFSLAKKMDIPDCRILRRPRSITSIGDRTPFTNLLVNAWSRWDFELYRICHQTQGTTSKSVTKHMGTVWVNYGQSMSKFYDSRGLGSQLISTCFEVFGYALRSLAFDAWTSQEMPRVFFSSLWFLQALFPWGLVQTCFFRCFWWSCPSMTGFWTSGQWFHGSRCVCGRFFGKGVAM